MDGALLLPGGLRVNDTLVREVHLREVSGHEEDILTDRRKKKDGSGTLLRSGRQRITDLLARCTIQMGDLVCEENKVPKTSSTTTFRKIWDDALTGDRGVATIEVRKLALGSAYPFPDTCPHCKKESARIVIQLDDLVVTPYYSKMLNAAEPDDALDVRIEVDKLLLERSYDLETPRGTRIKWQHMTPDAEDRMNELLKSSPESTMSAILCPRILEVEGEEVKLNSIKDLFTSDRRFLHDFFAEVDGGIDTDIEIVCDNEECGSTFNRKLDVGKHSFFFPSGTSSASKTTSSR